jgi:hypothetical protein
VQQVTQVKLGAAKRLIGRQAVTHGAAGPPHGRAQPANLRLASGHHEPHIEKRSSERSPPVVRACCACSLGPFIRMCTAAVFVTGHPEGRLDLHNADISGPGTLFEGWPNVVGGVRELGAVLAAVAWRGKQMADTTSDVVVKRLVAWGMDTAWPLWATAGNDQNTRPTVRRAPVVMMCGPTPLGLAGVSEKLRGAGAIVLVTRSYGGCLRVATALGPDVVVLDTSAPDRLRRLLRAHPVSARARNVYIALTPPLDEAQLLHDILGAVSQEPSMGAYARPH